MEIALPWVQIFVLGVVRVAAFLVQAPILGTSAVPMLVKVMLALVLGFFLMPGDAVSAANQAWGWLPFMLLLLKETLVGWLMGISLFVLMAALQAAGELVGFQMMFSAASTFSMLNLEQSTVTGNLFNFLAMLVFVGVDGHHALLGALDLSFRVLPVFSFPASLGTFHAWSTLLGRIFEISVKLSLPLLAALFITNAILGMIARTMPQINVFVIGMPVQIVAGFVILIMMLGGLIAAETHGFMQWAHELKGFIHQLQP
ncbi:MAG: flagellar biosynthetic protein FliR [Candidatus Firestonebacteria bacterium]|nr:flagellar biosynthetic protein FliR [Candidatus Firestonebacteria bacterium]